MKGVKLQRAKSRWLNKVISRILCLTLIMGLSFQMPLNGGRSYAATFQDVNLTVSQSSLDVTMSYATGTSGELFYVITEDTAHNYTAAEIESLVSSGTGVISKGSEATAYGSGPIHLTIDISTSNYIATKGYKFFAVLKEGGSYSDVLEKGFMKGDFSQSPVVSRTMKNGFNLTVTSTIPGMLYMAMTDPFQSTPVPTPAAIIDGTSNDFTATIKTGLTPNQASLIPMRSAEDLPYRAYDIYYTFVDAYGAVHNAAVDTAYSLSAVQALGNTMDVMYYRVGDPADYSDDSILIKCGTGINDKGDNSLYQLTFHSTKADLQADMTDFDVAIDGSTLYLNLKNLLVEKLYNSDLFDGGSFSLTIANGSSLEPKFESGYNTLTSPLTIGDLQASDRKFLTGIQYDNNATADDLSDDSLILTLPDMASSLGHLTITVSEDSVRGYGTTKRTLEQDTDFSVVPFTSTEAKITFASGILESLRALSFPMLRVTPTDGDWGTLKLSLSGNSLLLPLPSSDNTLTQIKIDGRLIDAFSSDVYEYHHIPLSFSKYARSSYLESAGYVSVQAHKLNTPYTVYYDSNLQKININVLSDAGTTATYLVGLAVNPFSLVSLKVNGQSVSGFYSNIGHVVAEVSPGVTNPTIEAVFENTSLTLSSFQVAESGTLPGEKTFEYTLTDYPNLKLTIQVKTAQVNPETPVSNGTGVTPVVNTDILRDRVQSLTTTITPQSTSADLLETLNQVSDLLKTSQNDDQRYVLVKNLDRTVINMANWLEGNKQASQSERLKIEGQISELTTLVASNLEKMPYSVNAVQSVVPFISALGEFKRAGADPVMALDSQVESILSRLSERLGTVEITNSNAKNEALTNQLMSEAIERQNRYFEEIRLASKDYFEDESRKIPKTLLFNVEGNEKDELIELAMPSGMMNALLDSDLDRVKISGSHSGMTLPKSVFNSSESIVFQIKPSHVSGLPFVDFEIMSNNVPMDLSQNPVALNFNLENFGFSASDWQSLSVYRKNPITGELDPVGGQIDTLQGTIKVLRGSLSQYTVMKSSKTFSDADQSWAKAEINAALNKGIVEASTNFEPKAAMTRGEFASWIAKAYGLKASGKAIPFKDVPKTHKHYTEIAAVFEAGLIDGKSKTVFDPAGTLSASELAVILGKTLVKFDNKQTSEKVTSKHLAALKSADTATWAQSDMALLQELGFSTQKELASLKGAVTKEVAAAAFMKAYQTS